jgi:hypothetical protein
MRLPFGVETKRLNKLIAETMIMQPPERSMEISKHDNYI